jgi:hypothetical protein
MVSKSFAKYAPWFTGTACLIYIYSWTEGIQFEAWTPLIWCVGCFVNDLHNYLEQKYEH